MNCISKNMSRLFIASILTLLAGCTAIGLPRESPLNDAQQSIQIGSTTRSDVHNLLGLPDDHDLIDSWEVYSAVGSQIEVLTFVVVPFGFSHIIAYYYLLLTYDTSERVSAMDTADSTYEPGGVLFAGNYGYLISTKTIFPSIDGGGKADKAWAIYLHYESIGRKGYSGYAFSELCYAAEQEHPCALKELGNYYWEGSYDFDEDRIDRCIDVRSVDYPSIVENDNVNACIWYSMANDKVLTPRCREALSDEDALIVERLLVDWQPTQCEKQLAPYRCGWRGRKLCE
jgi:hypothetical protein